MPDYQIQAPDGNTYRISGPPNATRDQIIAHVTAKYPQAAKPKSTSGPSALGLGTPDDDPVQKLKNLVTVGKDVAGGLVNPKELGREAYHTMADWAADTMKAAGDLGDWVSDKTGYYGVHIGKGGVSLTSKDQYYNQHIAGHEDLDVMVEKALKSEDLVREPQTVTGNVIRDVGEFTLGMLTAGKVFNVANKAAQGGIAAWTVFDPQQGRLSDILVKYPVLRNPVTQFLASKPGDSQMEARFKSTVEGVVGGKVAVGLARSLTLMRTAMKGKTAATAFEHEPLPPGDKPKVKLTDRQVVPGKPHFTLVQQGQAEAKVEAAAQVAAGKTPDVGEGVAKSASAVEAESKPAKPKSPTQSMEQAFSPTPLAEKAKGSLQEWWKWARSMVAPEALSPEAKQAGADIAAAYAEHAQHTETLFRQSPARREFWATQTAKVRGDFVTAFEQGKTHANAILDKAAEFYSTWMAKLEMLERVNGIEYTHEEHYLPHLFENEKGVEQWLRERGTKEPSFSKQRSFSLYEQATKAGFKPRFTNLEDIFQARQHASDLALARITAIKHLEETGMAIEDGKPGRPGFSSTYSAPNGKSYLVHDDAKLLLNRMFDERSLWQDKGLLGSAYRGMVTLKNNLIPVRLAFSAFHPLHVLSMHLAAGASRSMKAGEWMKSSYSEGSRTLSLLRGEIADKDITATDKQSLQYLADGGLVLEQDPRYRTQALERLRTEFVKANPGALLHVHTGALQAIQNVIFKTWIPSLKGASYLADVRAALKAQPNLIDDSAARRVAFRRLAKSVENRYGEMNYNTLFWQRTLRDVSVLSATSMGWQLGLFREYGGGAGQLANAIGKVALRPGNAKEITNTLRKSGDLDKLIYIANYTTLAGVLGGLATWAMTGKRPNSGLDLWAPRTGEMNPDGTPARVRTMFYPYEFAAMTKRVETQGLVKATEEWLSSKGSGIPSMLAETMTGVDGLGREIRDPNGRPWEQARQTLDAILLANEPISLQNRGTGPESGKQKALDVAGMTRAPKYLQETSGEAQIEGLWQREYKTAETPFTQSVKSAERQKLQAAVKSGDNEGANKILMDMATKFNLRPQDAKRLARDANTGLTSYQALFREMRGDDQKRILAKMEPAERAKYLPFAKRQIQAEFAQ
jgi:hypothetical protein